MNFFTFSTLLTNSNSSTPPAIIPADFYRATQSVSDGNANIFVFQPEDIDNPPTGGWPLVIFFGGDGTSNNNTTVVSNQALSTSDNLTYTHSPSLGGFRMMVSSIRVKVNSVEVGRGYIGGTITGTGLSGSVTSYDDGTPNVSITFTSSQAGNTVTYDYIYSTVFIEGPMRFANLGENFDNRAVVICIQNIGNTVDYERDYFDNTVTYAWNNFTINPNRSAWGISRGGRQIIDQFSNGANTSVLKTRYQFWIDEAAGTIHTSAGAGRVESGLASLVVGTASYGGSFTAANYTDIGMAIVHGTSDGTLTNSTPSFAATMTSNNEPPYIYNVRGGFHDTNVWDNNCYNRSTAVFDFVDFTFKYSRNDLERATLFVEQAEKRRLNTEKDIIDYRHALRQVNALSSSAEKTA
ncbi:MAG TPA: hypothetical protein PLJ08_22670, partial [Cyclobacteriaceae bacterium]|nr:hypothetical protein [Cyclobacteriaceae bacterium]